MAQIDFQPAEISGLELRGTELVILFPGQSLYDELSHERDSVPIYRCELGLRDGRFIGENSLVFPMKIDNLWIEFRGGGRGFYLPTDFTEDGSVEVRVGSLIEESGWFAWRPLAAGDRVSLRIFEKVGDLPVTYEP